MAGRFDSTGSGYSKRGNLKMAVSRTVSDHQGERGG